MDLLMIDDVLVPIDALMACPQELWRRVATLPLAIPADEGEAGEALSFALLFEHWPETRFPVRPTSCKQARRRDAVSQRAQRNETREPVKRL